MAAPEIEIHDDGHEYLKGTNTRVWRGVDLGRPGKTRQPSSQKLTDPNEPTAEENDIADAQFHELDSDPSADQAPARPSLAPELSIDLTKLGHRLRQGYTPVEHAPENAADWQNREALGQPVVTKVGGRAALPEPDFMDFEATEQEARRQALIKVDRERRERENRESFQADAALLATRCALMLADELSANELEGTLLVDQQAEEQKRQANKQSRLSRLLHRHEETPKPTEYVATYEVDMPVGNDGSYKHYSVAIYGHREDGQPSFTLKRASCQERYIKQFTDTDGRKYQSPVGGYDLAMTPQFSGEDVVTGLDIHIEPNGFASYQSPWTRTIASDMVDGLRNEYPEEIKVTYGYDIQLDGTDLENPVTVSMHGTDGAPIRSRYDADNDTFIPERYTTNSGQWQRAQNPLGRNFGQTNMTNLTRETLGHYIANPQHARPEFWPIPEKEFSWNQKDNLDQG